MSTTGYFRIRLTTLIGTALLPFNVYILIDQKVILYVKMGDKIPKEKILSLHAKDSGESFILAIADKEKYQHYIRDLMNSNTYPDSEKAIILKESSIAILEDLFDNPDVKQALSDSKPIITDLINFMQNAPNEMGNLITLSGHDFYTYNHSFDVSIYSLGLGQALGFTKTELEELGLSSLYHDLGKRLVPLEILCKKGALDDNEWIQMRMHPQLGLKILNEHVNISDAIKAACYEHHESWAGGGYPQGIAKQDIHPFARIVALTDTYDAMTTQRSYNTPMKPADALNLMNGNLAQRYDPDMLKAMYSVLFKMNKDAA
ncbi:MAG: HD domain-containing protein [Bdellovibrionaceae bacterium]|nr:HD domain-containing protein [Pseudobdellovibrionaceae bacterium]